MLLPYMQWRRAQRGQGVAECASSPQRKNYQISIRKDRSRPQQCKLIADLSNQSGEEKGIGEINYAEIGAEGLVQVYVYNVEVKPQHRRQGVAAQLLSRLYKDFPRGPFSLRFRPDPNTAENTMASWRLYRKWARSHNMSITTIGSENSGESRSDKAGDDQKDRVRCQGDSSDCRECERKGDDAAGIVGPDTVASAMVDLSDDEYIPPLNSTLWLNPVPEAFKFRLPTTAGDWTTVSFDVVTDPIQSGAFGTGWRLWECGILMARFLEPTEDEDENYFPLRYFENKRVRTLELGGGVGLVSFCLAALGAHAVLTDLPRVLENTSTVNVEHNAKAIRETGNGGQITLAPLDWKWITPANGDNTTTETQMEKFTEPLRKAGVEESKFDLVFGGDLVFHFESVKPLVQVARRVLSKKGEFLMSHKNRRQELKETMIKEFKTAGFIVEEMETKHRQLTIFRITWKDKQ